MNDKELIGKVHSSMHHQCQKKGIRRAKDALLENGSPELKFYPDNEEDNYTNAVMGVNEEFLKEFNGSTTKETTKETERLIYGWCGLRTAPANRVNLLYYDIEKSRIRIDENGQ